MSFPRFPNPARRAKLLQAHQLRQQGLTIRQIAEIMHCAPSTVVGYLRDFELFRNDLLHELAADQLVSHVIQLADITDQHHDRRLATARELRLLLGSVAQIRRDEDDRAMELLQNGVSVDRYGNRYLLLNRFHPPTAEEQAQLEQLAQQPPPTDLNLDQPLALPPAPLSPPEGDAAPTPVLPPCEGRCRIPFPSPPLAGGDAEGRGGSPAGDAPSTPVLPPPGGDAENLPPARTGGRGGAAEQPTTPSRTKPNNTEQPTTPNPAHNGKSSPDDPKSPAQPSVPDSIGAPPDSEPQSPVPPDIRDFLKHSSRDWLNDYPRHNPNHPLHLAALQLKAEREAAAQSPLPE